MENRKCLALAISFVLGLVACSQQAQKPQELEQDPQQSEVITSQTPVEAQPLEVKQEVDPSAPVEETPGVEDGAEDPEDPGDPEEPGAPEEPGEPVEVQLYTDVNEVVYAIGTVNIRASWSATSEKLGSMGIGESVTRTGVPIPGIEAEGWSRVCLADGSTAYMHSSLLSTTQPSTQPASQPSTGSGSGSGAGTQTPATGGNGTGTQAPATGGGTASTGNRDGWDQAFYETLNDYQKQRYEAKETAGERLAMQAQIEVERNLAAQGYYNNWSTDPDVVRKGWESISH